MPHRCVWELRCCHRDSAAAAGNTLLKPTGADSRNTALSVLGIASRNFGQLLSDVSTHFFAARDEKHATRVPGTRSTVYYATRQISGS